MSRRLRKVVDVERLLLVARPVMVGPLPEGTREGSTADIDALVDLYGRGRLAVQTRRRRARIARRFDRGDICVVTEDPSGRLVGCAWLASTPLRLDRYRVRADASVHDTYLYGLRVATSAQRSGIGERTITAAHAVAAGRGAKNVQGHISPRNPATPHLFFDKVGSSRVGDCTVLVLGDRFGVELAPLRNAFDRRGRRHPGRPG